MKITKEENKELTADELKMVAGGESLRDEYFNKSTELLKEARERLPAKVGDNNKLWNLINTAENALTTSERKDLIENAYDCLVCGLYSLFLSAEDYEFIRQKLSESRHYNFLAQLEEY